MMKRLILFLVLSTLVFGVSAREIDRIIARVNNEVITTRDLDDYCQALAFGTKGSSEAVGCENEEQRGQALLGLINDKLIIYKAKKDEIEIPNVWIEGKLNQIIASYPSREDFDKSLIERGYNITLLKEKIKEQYLVKETIDNNVRSTIVISPSEVTDYYELHIDEFQLPPRYVLWVVMSQDESLIDKVHRSAKNKGMEYVEKEFSEEIIVIESNPDELKEGLSDVVASLREGDFTVKDINGTKHFVYLEEILPAQNVSLEEEHTKITAFLKEKKFREKFADWIKKLQEEAVIVVYQ
jgi:peptidyl-prolyl cis-trans isomerase SurA